MRYSWWIGVAAVLGLVVFWNASGAAPSIAVYKDANCGCCSLWVEHLRANGFEVTVQDVENMNDYKDQYGVPGPLRSCHTGIVDGYTIEGHVPASEIRRLLDERPDARGLSVPGMPLGSPGMEAGPRRQRYDVLLFDDAGNTSVYEEYAAQ
jgi:hypothetical protein